MRRSALCVAGSRWLPLPLAGALFYGLAAFHACGPFAPYAPREQVQWLAQAPPEAASAGSADELHVVFTADCRPFNSWQAELLFHSALAVRQRGPITAIISGCDDTVRAHMQQRHRSLGWPASFKQYFVPTFNASKWSSKPLGFRHWYKHAGPSRDVVALMDCDFAFLRPLTAVQAVHTRPGFPRKWTGTMPDRVKQGIVVGQRYANINRFSSKEPFVLRYEGHNMTKATFLNWACSGDESGHGKSGCTNLTYGDMSLFHSTGVPYIAHRDDWDRLADSWAEIHSRLTRYASKEQQIYVDMFSWSLANAHRGQRQFVSESLMLSAPRAIFEDWTPVDTLQVDACHADFDDVLAHATRGHDPEGILGKRPLKEQIAPFVHYCVTVRAPYPSLQDQDGGVLWSKYWFDQGLKSGQPHALERCNQTAAAPKVGGYPGHKWMKRAPPRRRMPNASMTLLERRQRFLACAMRALFRRAARAACPDSPLSMDLAEQTEPAEGE